MRDIAPANRSLDAMHRGDEFRNYVPPKTMHSLGSNIGSYSHPALNLIVYCSPRVRIRQTGAGQTNEAKSRAYPFFFFKIIDPSESERS